VREPAVERTEKLYARRERYEEGKRKVMIE
jgi:hypothetical protein